MDCSGSKCLRDINALVFPHTTVMTIQSCASFCTTNGYLYFGLEYA